MFQAGEYCENFKESSYLWLEDREIFLQQFVTYGRKLTAEEVELIAIGNDGAPEEHSPTLSQFKEKVHSICILMFYHKISSLSISNLGLGI